MSASFAQQVGLVVLTVLAAATVLAGPGRRRAAAMAGALVLAPVMLLSDIWDSAQIVSLRGHPAETAVLGGVALVALAVAGALAARRPAWAVVAAVAMLPFRVPVHVGGQTANLLVPLYFVIAAGGLGLIVADLRGASTERAAPSRRGGLELALLGFVVLYAIQSVYSADFTKALQHVAFFYVPFALMLACVRDVRFTRRLTITCLGVLAGLAVCFALVGFVEYGARTLLFNRDVIASNRYESYFRINSLFFDPNIYGRFEALVMLLVAAGLAWTRRWRTALAAVAALGVLWAGMALSFSQSSFVALLVGGAVLAALRWGRLRALTPVAAVVVAGVIVVAAAPGLVHLNSRTHALNADTSGRFALVRGGADLFAHRPAGGFGSGSFHREYRRHHKAPNRTSATVSHTIPITVAAEQGAIGLAAYVALVLTALITLLRGAGGDMRRAAIAAAFVALVVHTLAYADFLEDPVTWMLLAVGLALARAPGDSTRESAPRRVAGEHATRLPGWRVPAAAMVQRRIARGPNPRHS